MEAASIKPGGIGQMSVARITEISSSSDKNFEDAIEQGIARATQTLHGIRSAWVKEQEVQVENGKIASYKVIMKITFVLDEP
jgi:dodecin